MEQYNVRCQIMKPGTYSVFPFTVNANGDTLATILIDEYYDYYFRHNCYKVLVEAVTTRVESQVAATGFDKDCNPFGLRRVTNTHVESKTFEYSFNNLKSLSEFFEPLGLRSSIYEDFTSILPSYERGGLLIVDEQSSSCISLDELFDDDIDFNDPLGLGIASDFDLII